MLFVEGPCLLHLVLCPFTNGYPFVTAGHQILFHRTHQDGFAVRWGGAPVHSAWVGYPWTLLGFPLASLFTLEINSLFKTEKQEEGGVTHNMHKKILVSWGEGQLQNSFKSLQGQTQGASNTKLYQPSTTLIYIHINRPKCTVTRGTHRKKMANPSGWVCTIANPSRWVYA